MKIMTRHAAKSDLDLLTEMNKQLIEDEGSRNPMNVSELHERMSGWLQEGWGIRMIEDADDQTVFGYAVFLTRIDDYDPQQKEVYLRQLFIKRDKRSQGVGELALKYLIDNDFPDKCRVAIDVLATNPRGEAYWKRMGFKPYYTNMQLLTNSEK